MSPPSLAPTHDHRHERAASSLAPSRASGGAPLASDEPWVGFAQAPRVMAGVGATALPVVAASLVLVIADVAHRGGLAREILFGHVVAATGLFVACAVLLALSARVVAAVAARVSHLLEPARRERFVRAALGSVAAAFVLHVASPVTHGRRFDGRASSLALMGVFAAAAFAAVVAWRGYGGRLRALEVAGRRAQLRAHALVLTAAAFALLGADARVLPSLYSSLHVLVELVAVSALTLAARAAYASSRGVPSAVARVAMALGIVAGVWAIAFATVPSLRAAHRARLRHVVSDPRIVGHALSMASRRRSSSPSPVTLAPVAAVSDGAAHAPTRWRAPESDRARSHAAAARAQASAANIVVYFVDTLRADVAASAALMPNLARFGRRAVRFRRAYSTGSDTLRALPNLLEGSYAVDGAPRSLGEAARQRSMASRVFISASAQQFLEGTMGPIPFDGTEVEADTSARAGPVWGYGADERTGPKIVDRALSWMTAQKDKRFLAWVHNYDLHAWRELPDPLVLDHARRHSIPTHGGPAWKYRAVAHMIDESFGRLVAGLARAGLDRNTVILFVSDHGEALGEHDHWVHSVFLWESLVRVPLLLAAPGLSAGAVDEPVSLVDVAPTLLRYVDRDHDASSSDGVDLLRYVGPEAPSRERPLMLHAQNEGQASFLGLVSGEQKLVVPLVWGAPQLLDLRAVVPDESDVSDARPDDLRAMLDLMQVGRLSEEESRVVASVASELGPGP